MSEKKTKFDMRYQNQNRKSLFKIEIKPKKTKPVTDIKTKKCLDSSLNTTTA